MDPFPSPTAPLHPHPPNRYISEEYAGQALHPIDVLDISTGRALRSLADENLTTISPVVAFHPRCVRVFMTCAFFCGCVLLRHTPE